MRLTPLLIAASLLSLASMGSRADENNAGTIHFTGEIVDPSCTITGDSGKDSTVYLGSFAPSFFTGNGGKSDDAAFTITLAGCPVATTGLDRIQLTFKGITIVGHDDLLALTAGCATGVGISVSTEAAPTTNLNLTGADGQVYIPLQATSADISQNFVARYESYDATPITPGNAYADMTVNILYR